MLLSKDAKLLVCHRRLFEEDHVRFFVGAVQTYADGIAKVSGYTWTRDPSRGFQRKPRPRNKLIPLASHALIIYEIPEHVDVAKIKITQPSGHTITAADGEGFEMDLSERP